MIRIKDKKKLLAQLKQASILAGITKTLPIINNVRVVFEQQKVSVTSTDLNTIITITEDDIIDYIPNKEEICVYPKELISLLENIDENEFKIKLSQNQLNVIHSKGEATFAFWDADEFPTLKFDKKESVVLKINSHLLLQELILSKNFCNKTQDRPILNGVRLLCSNNTMRVSASDAVVLYDNKININETLACEKSGVVNNMSLSCIISILQSNKDTMCSISFNDKNIMIEQNTNKVITRLVEGRFPNVDILIRKESPINIDVDINTLRQSINRLLITSNVANNLIKMTVSNDNYITLESEDLQSAKKAKEMLPVNIINSSNENLTIGLNGRRLLNCLSSITSEQIQLQIKDKNSIIVIKDKNDFLNKNILLCAVQID